MLKAVLKVAFAAALAIVIATNVAEAFNGLEGVVSALQGKGAPSPK